MISKRNISSIIFDLGGVILNINPQLTVDRFRAIGFSGIETFLDHYRSLGFMADFQTGRITESQFYDEIWKESGLVISNQVIKEAWNAMLLDYPLNRIAKIKELKKNYKLFLLSNTNIVHYQDFAFRVPSVSQLSDLFDDVYYSHEIEKSKPNADAYEFVLEANKLKAETTLFLDDLPENIATAKELGIQTYWVTNANLWPDEITSFLKEE
jgi:putative hydrolase of the HAD superfamily